MSAQADSRVSALRLLLLAAALPTSLAIVTTSTYAQVIFHSAANIPYSAVSPGGVDMSTGELVAVQRPDLYLDGPIPVSFTRYYASLLASDGAASGHLGPNWLGSFDWTLAVAGSNATLVTDRGAVIRFTQSPTGSWDLASPTYAKFRLDVLAGGVWRFTNPLDRRLYFFDGATWLLNRIEDEHGNALMLTNTGGLLTQVTDGLGRVLTFTYDAASASGHLIQVSDGTRAVHYTYSGGLLSGVQDAAGRNWTLSYSTLGPYLIGVLEPMGNTPLTQSYDATGRVMSQRDALSNMAMYEYGTPSGNVFHDPAGNPWTYQHDSQGRLMTWLDPMGGPTSYGYDAQGRVSMVTRPLGDPASFSYDPGSGYPSMVSFADGSAISWGYSPHPAGTASIYDLTLVTYQDATTESYGRDASGNVTDLMDQGGFHWTGTYNSHGQLLTWTNPAGGVTTFTYDPQGRPATGRDNAGNVTGYAYDPLSRLTQITWPDLTHRSFAYDNLDALTGITDERGKAWSYAYDTNGRLTTETDPLLNATGFVYDEMDRITRRVDGLGHPTIYAYDANGRVMSMTDRSGRMTTYQYDALSRLSGIMDPAGAASSFGYDLNSRMTSTQDALGHGSTYGYDPLDRLTHRTDPVGTNFDYSYDIAGRIHTATAPLGHVETFDYDARGLLRDYFEGGSETDLPRTTLGEISRVTDPNRNDWPRTYDLQGRITGSADPLSRGTTYEYDGLSRVIHVGRPDGTLEQINFDAGGRVAGKSFSGGPTLSYGYDDANRLLGGTGASFGYDTAGRMTNSNGFTFTYDPDGRVLSETLAPGKMVSYSYDSRGLPSQVTDWIGGVTTFTFDAAHRLTGITRPNGTSATYDYDAANRLINKVEKSPGPSQTPIASIAITRDVLGQPTSINRRQPLMPGSTMSSSSSFTYDAASQLNGVGHDALGRTTGGGARTFQWDGASRLIHFAAGVDSPFYAYDAFGQQTHGTQGSQVVQQAWNYGWQHPDMDDTEVNLPSPHTSYFVRAPSGLLLYSMDGGTGGRSFYHYDEAGNTSFLTSDVGSVTTQYAYTPYGRMAAVGETGGNPFTFGGAGGALQLGGSGAFQIGGGIYDAITMRTISGNTIVSGPGGTNPGPGSPGASVELNPQPLPPGASVALNPQPFPPAPGSSVELNPQPLPPGASVALNPQPFPPAPGSSVELNPQPLPPGASVALNPQPFPPGPTAFLTLSACAGLSGPSNNTIGGSAGIPSLFGAANNTIGGFMSLGVPDLGPSTIMNAHGWPGWIPSQVMYPYRNPAPNDDAPAPDLWWLQRTQMTAGTLMHEVGHNLRLSHGPSMTHGPAFLSTMQYGYQLQGISHLDGAPPDDGLPEPWEDAQSIDIDCEGVNTISGKVKPAYRGAGANYEQVYLDAGHSSQGRACTWCVQ